MSQARLPSDRLARAQTQPAWRCLFSRLRLFSCPRQRLDPGPSVTLSALEREEDGGLGTVHRILSIIPEPLGDTGAPVGISPGVIHFTWTGCPLVDTTWTVYNPHFKGKATEAWSAADIG